MDYLKLMMKLLLTPVLELHRLLDVFVDLVVLMRWINRQDLTYYHLTQL